VIWGLWVTHLYQASKN